MQISDPNYHLRLIEMCECHLETDYASALQKIADSSDSESDEDALKYLALALLYAVTEKAESLSFKQKKGKITVTLKTDGDKVALRHPKKALFDRIISMVRAILHFDKDKDSLPLCLGLRNVQLDLLVKFERTDDKETLKFKLPNLGSD